MEVIKKKVSCHVITYNQVNYISKCIDGILMQKTNFDFEVIIGDDLSTDGTREVLEKYANDYPHLIRLNLRTVRGVGIPGKENFISTLKMCEGEYVSLCEGDDYWTDPYKLQKQVDFFEANPDYVLSFHQVKILKPNGELVSDFITKVPENYETIETLARLGNYIHTPSVVFRNVIQEFPFEFSLTPIGDYFLYLLLAEHGKLKFMDGEMAVYRYGVGIHSVKTKLQNVKSSLELFALLLSSLKDDKVKEIIHQRIQYLITVLEQTTRDQYNEYFVSKHIFFRGIKSIKKNYKTPHVIVSKFFRFVVKNRM